MLPNLSKLPHAQSTDAIDAELVDELKKAAEERARRLERAGPRLTPVSPAPSEDDRRRRAELDELRERTRSLRPVSEEDVLKEADALLATSEGSSSDDEVDDEVDDESDDESDGGESVDFGADDVTDAVEKFDFFELSDVREKLVELIEDIDGLDLEDEPRAERAMREMKTRMESNLRILDAILLQMDAEHLSLILNGPPRSRAPLVVDRVDPVDPATPRTVTLRDPPDASRGAVQILQRAMGMSLNSRRSRAFFSAIVLPVMGVLLYLLMQYTQPEPEPAARPPPGFFYAPPNLSAPAAAAASLHPSTTGATLVPGASRHHRDRAARRRLRASTVVVRAVRRLRQSVAEAFAIDAVDANA